LAGPDIFGDYATLIAQILTLVTIATIIINVGKKLANKRAPRDFIFFFLTIAAVIGMQLIAIYNFSQQQMQLTKLENKQIALQNVTLKLQNTTIANQHLLFDIHKKLSAATIVNNTHLLPLQQTSKQ